MSSLIPRKQIDIGAAPYFTNTTVPAGNTVAGTSAETPFYTTIPLPAAQFKIGDLLSVRLRGVYTCTLTVPPLRLRAYLGSTLVGDTSSLTSLVGNVGNAGWGVDLDLVAQGVTSSGSLEVQGTAFVQSALNAASLVSLHNAASIPYDGTSASTLSFSAQWGVASLSNTITLRQISARYD